MSLTLTIRGVDFTVVEETEFNAAGDVARVVVACDDAGFDHLFGAHHALEPLRCGLGPGKGSMVIQAVDRTSAVTAAIALQHDPAVDYEPQP